MIQIFKSMIARPGRSIGLLIEVIIVTIIGWIVIEPVAVKTTTALIPPGYDYERLIKVSFSSFGRSSEKYDSLIPNDKQHRDEAYDRILRMVRERKDVEKATYDYNQGFESSSYANNSIKADTAYLKEEETKIQSIGIIAVTYKPGTDYFATYGIKDVNGNPFVEPQNDGSSVIISKTAAKILSRDGKVIGKELFDWGQEDNDDHKHIIAGITGDLSYRKGYGRQALYFEAANEDDEWTRPNGIIIRLKEGVSPMTFIDNLTKEISDYRSGNIYITHPQTLSDMRNTIFSDKKRELTQKWIIVIFFLVNMLLGIAGSFYVQCKTRIPDAGVMRAFGASRIRIEWSIIGEACILAFIGWVIGTVIYLIYLKFQGFPMETDAQTLVKTIRPIWHDTKLGRYSIIGGIILLMLLATSALGAWLPARKVGRVPIVDSLRDE